MTLNLQKHKDELLFLPLGGAGEIGMNLNLYHLEGKWLMVDCGAGFAEDYLPGVDLIVPDIEFIMKEQKNLLGLVVTHIHEDHQGGIQYLWKELGCPIYTTKFTGAFIKNRLKETPFAGDVKIHVIPEGGKKKIGPFDIEFVPLNHSTPEMNALMIRTKHGNIFHTGDWKQDSSPIIGSPNNEEKLRALGEEGILAMVGDSTNVFNEGHSGSEGILQQSLTKLISDVKKLCVVTTFASNVARLEGLAKAAQAADRHVILTGRSLWRIVEAAEEAGYLADLPPFLTDSELRRLPRNKVLVIATGCQGEPLAQMNKIAFGEHQNIKLNSDDTVIFSSKIIPGNEKKIARIFNHLSREGIEVLTERDHFVHVSGHPACEELQHMYHMLKPQISVPVHGEHIHMHEHGRLALKWGAKKSVLIENGEILKLAPNKPEKIARVESGIYAVDGKCLIHSSSDILRIRRRMKEAGIVFVTLVISKNKLISDPVIFAPGLLEQDDALYDDLQEELNLALDEFLRKAKIPSQADLEKVIRPALRRIINRELNKKPLIEIAIQFV